MPGKNVTERRSGLRPSEKELQERHSGAFRHKNTPECTVVTKLFLLTVNNNFVVSPCLVKYSPYSRIAC
jgi:hypothetical protein